MKAGLLDAPRWLFLGLLIYAPWAYGCTRPWTIVVLNWGLGTVILLWLAAAVAARRWPRLPLLAVGTAGLLLAQGWLMVSNAHQLHDADFAQFVPVAAWWPGGPGVIDAATSVHAMGRITALLGAFLFAIDLAQQASWRPRLAWAILLAGGSFAAFGLMQRILGAPMIFWEAGRTAPTFFGTYVYHANAGAFLNLVLPFIAMLTVAAFRERGHDTARALCVPALFLTIAAAFVNVSKAAMVITLGLLGGLAFRALRGRGELAWRRLLLGAGGVAAVVVFLVALIGWEPALRRWGKLPAILHDNPRTAVAETCQRMMADASWWGFGPGSFEIIFPHYTAPLGDRVSGIWRYAHQDYWQTAVEWGWAGAALWAVLIFGGLALNARNVRRQGSDLSFAAGLALAGAALHALVDFPFQIASLQLYILVCAAIGWAGAAHVRAPET